MAGPNEVGVEVWVLLVPGLGVFVLGVGFPSRPKTVGFRDMTQQKGVLPADPADLVGQLARGYGPSARA